MAIYQVDPDSAPDSAFIPGTLALLVAGNRGRLLDARRTPVEVTAVRPERGGFEVEILAFEDAGSRWELDLKEIERFQFAHGSAAATAGDLRELHAAVRRFAVPLVIEQDSGAHARTEDAIQQDRQFVREAFANVGVRPEDLAARVADRDNHPPAVQVTQRLLADRNMLDLDEAFASAFVSNPNAGELVKAHAIVAAELGLCRYEGQIVRDDGVFARWSKVERARHIIFRLALTRQLYAQLEHEAVTLFRAAAVEGEWRPNRVRSFVSATFSRAVAEEHFAGNARTQAAVMWRQNVPAQRLFMTFLETPGLNHQFKEAEAVLVGDPGNALF